MFISKKTDLNYQEAKDKALRLLGVRDHSEKELSDKLKRAGASDEDIEKILEFLREYGMVNDERFAKTYCEYLHTVKRFGKKKIEYELKSKGIDSIYVQEALEEIEEYTDEELIPMIEKRLKGDFSTKQKNKVKRYFYNRGFSMTDVNNCIERIISENEL